MSDTETDDVDSGRKLKRGRRQMFLVACFGLPDVAPFLSECWGIAGGGPGSRHSALSPATYLTPIFKPRSAPPGCGVIPRFEPRLDDFQTESRRVRRRYVAADRHRHAGDRPHLLERNSRIGSKPEFRHGRLRHRHGEVLSEWGIGPAVRDCYESCRFGDCVDLQRFGQASAPPEVGLQDVRTSMFDELPKGMPSMMVLPSGDRHPGDCSL